MAQDPFDLATKDPITGLYNRSFLEKEVNDLLLRAHRDSELSFLLMIDFAHFKQYMDKYGLKQGNQALKTVADYLKGIEGKTVDIVGRLDSRDRIVAFWTQKNEGEASETQAKELAELVRVGVTGIQIPKYDEADPKLTSGHQTVGVNMVLLAYADHDDVHSKAGKLIDKAGEAIEDMKRKNQSFSFVNLLKQN